MSWAAPWTIYWHRDASRRTGRGPTRELGRLSVSPRVVGVVALGLVLALGMPSVTRAAPEVSPEPTPGCAERYPTDGPGGIDLRLGCIVRELVDAFSGNSTATNEPARISAYSGPILAVVGVLAAIVLLIWLVGRRAARRMAPILPAAWWLCPACHSANPATALSCYACRAHRTSDAMVLPTAGHPGAPPDSAADPTTGQADD